MIKFKYLTIPSGPKLDWCLERIPKGIFLDQYNNTNLVIIDVYSPEYTLFILKWGSIDD